MPVFAHRQVQSREELFGVGVRPVERAHDHLGFARVSHGVRVDRSKTGRESVRKNSFGKHRPKLTPCTPLNDICSQDLLGTVDPRCFGPKTGRPTESRAGTTQSNSRIRIASLGVRSSTHLALYQVRAPYARHGQSYWFPQEIMVFSHTGSLNTIHRLGHE